MKVSVAVCTFNGEEYIADQLVSILAQTRLVDEIVVCDDGSTDRTVEIVQGVADTCREGINIRVIPNPTTLGCTDNFAKAISLAAGDIIFLSDQDDVWFDTRVEAMLEVFEEDAEAGFVYCDAIVTDVSLRTIHESIMAKRRGQLADDNRPTAELIKRAGINACTLAFRASLRPYILPMPAEWPHSRWLAAILHAVAKPYYLRRPLMYYRRHDKACSQSMKIGSVQRAKARLNWHISDELESRLARHQEVRERLREIRDRGDITGGPTQRLDDTICELDAHMSILRSRIGIIYLPKAKRVFPVFHLLVRGRYHRQAGGLISAAKDLIAV
ncbi:MAG: glycosyltransferase [Armatimonadetes bacterium]|nr:glycosyltransferase [Armatimonadota bacterium]